MEFPVKQKIKLVFGVLSCDAPEVFVSKPANALKPVL